jgi:hypothetical protein
MMTSRNVKRWEDLSTQKKAAVMLLGVIQVTLLAAALLDIRRRPPEQINGSKRMWTLLAFINYIGPIAYFLFGRKPAEIVNSD